MENQSKNIKIVENVDKVEAAISNFRENQRKINEEKQRSKTSEQVLITCFFLRNHFPLRCQFSIN
jgi:hypothetical protein